MLAVRQERISRKWTLDYVGSIVGLTKSAVHDIEVGRCYPSYSVLVKYENLYGLPHNKLFAEADAPCLLTASTATT
jgi:transcriptional regulator with XRE-family HTH domain